VILNRDEAVPVVAVAVYYNVGSRNEREGRTGFAHLFEHMMFQGSENVKKAEHFQFIMKAGGTMNGTTSSERTNYFETLPASQLPLALWLESDRMRSLAGHAGEPRQPARRLLKKRSGFATTTSRTGRSSI
jgi:predicted Zn-dependent peptidase